MLGRRRPSTVTSPPAMAAANGPGARDDPVRHGGVLDRRERLDALDLERRRDRRRRYRAHRLQHRADVDDLGLPRRVVDHGRALREDGGHEQVLGGADAREVQPQVAPCRRPAGRDEEAVLAAHRGAEALEPGDVHVEPAAADVVAAGQRDVGLPAAGEQRAEDVDRGAQPAHQVVVGLVRGHRGDRDGHRPGSGVAHDVAAQPAQELGHVLDVEDVRAPRAARSCPRRAGRRPSA